MTNRPAIPRQVQLDLLFECRYRCACCCEPVSLEKAHIIPWSATKDHSPANLVVLCANCHTRSHAEKWPESQLRRFKTNPCALERDRMPPMTPGQKLMVDFIVSADPDSMADKERIRFAMMAAAYAYVSFQGVTVVAVAPASSSLVRLEMPREAAERIIRGFEAEDPRLVSFLDEFARGPVMINFSLDSVDPEPANFGLDGGLKLIETARPLSADRPPVTNVKEEGLESLIVSAMTAFGWIAGASTDFEREYAVDLKQLTAFLEATQERVAAELELRTDGQTRRKFLAQLQGEITRRGFIDVMRKGVSHGKYHVDLFYGTPSPENQEAVERHAANRFSVTRQLHYSREETKRALDLALFINGLPVATFELKNSLTKQTAEDAEEQYKRDRDPRETLFAFGRCVVHFAMDDQEVRMCTELKGSKGMAKDSWFLPFNQG